jgi:outer membrane biosynthesis protein TonB
MIQPHRSPTRPRSGPVLASVALHVGVVALSVFLHRMTFSVPEYVSYEITLVSVADPNLPEEVNLPSPEELVVEMPDPEPTPPAPEVRPEPPAPPVRSEPAPAPTPERRPEPTPRPTPTPPAPTPPTPRPEPPRPQPPSERPPPTSETSTAPSNVDLNVRMAGLQRDFPAYYARILTAMSACWRQPPGVESVSTVMRFEIERDGSIRPRSIEAFRRSGNGIFDLRAAQAVECAGENQRIPPLPDDIPGDRLPVQFTFTATGFRD